MGGARRLSCYLDSDPLIQVIMLNAVDYLKAPYYTYFNMFIFRLGLT